MPRWKPEDAKPIEPVEIDREKLAWAAGFFDGEGCTNAQRHLNAYPGRAYPGYFTVVIQVSQAGDPYVLHRFRESVGNRGKVKGPYKNKGPNGRARPQYIFLAQSFEDAQAIICLLWEWLSPVKREQAKHHLRLYVDSRKGKNTFYGKRRSDGSCAMGHPASERGPKSGKCLACVRIRSQRDRDRKAAAKRDANLPIPM